jgi:chorismate mutase
MPWLKNVRVKQLDLVGRAAVRDPENPEEPQRFPLAKEDSAHTTMRAHYHEHEDGTNHVHAHQHHEGEASHDVAGHGHRVAKEDAAMSACLCGCEGIAKAELDRKGGPKRSELSDDDFAYIEPDAKKGPDGKTEDKYRHYPIMDKAHVRDALSRAAAAINAGGRTAEIARHALAKIKAAAKRMGIGEKEVAKQEALGTVLSLAKAEDGVASPLQLALGEDASRAVLALVQAVQTENNVEGLGKADMKPDADNKDPDGDGDDDTTPEGDTDHDYWNADGTPTAKGRSVGFTKAQGDADLSKSETPEELAKSEAERVSLAKEVSDLKARLAKAESVAKAEQEIRLTREYLAKAESYRRVPGISSEDLATVIRTVTEADPEKAAKLEAMLAATNSSMAKSELFREIGSSANGFTGQGALAKMQAAATAIAKEDPKLTPEKAMSEAQRRNPDLYQQYQREMRVAAREA